jgi:glycosyltransferase involved in cell wall biosynthesis
MKVFAYPSEPTMVGGYRVWQPLKAIARQKLAEVDYIKIDQIRDKDLTIPTDPPTPLFPNPRYKPEIGSYAEHSKWADLIVRQKLPNIPALSLLRAVKGMYKKPIVVDMDDNLLNVHRNNPVYDVFQNTEVWDTIEDRVEVKTPDEAKAYEEKGYLVVAYDYPDGIIYVCAKFKVAEAYASIEAMRIADALTVSCQELKDLYKQFNDNIYVLPNYIDTKRWSMVTQPAKDSNKIVLGWFGGQSHYDDVKLVADVIPALLDSNPNLYFRWCGTRFDFWRGMEEKYGERFEIKLWEEDPLKWEQHFANFNFDIMIAPLVDSKFNVCKSNIKWMEAAMLKIPVVASPVGPYKCIKHGVDGFLVNKHIEWIKSIQKLISNYNLRKQVGEAAYNRVVKEYNLEDHAHEWVEVYEEIVRKHNLKKAGIVLAR